MFVKSCLCSQQKRARDCHPLFCLFDAIFRQCYDNWVDKAVFTRNLEEFWASQIPLMYLTSSSLTHVSDIALPPINENARRSLHSLETLMLWFVHSIIP